MKRNERIGAIIKILSSNPNKIFTLNFFTNKFDCAKSSISEDIVIAKKIMETMKLGKIETLSGAAGGVKYMPIISKEDTKILQEQLCLKLKDENRILAGGFLYTSDIMFTSSIIKSAGEVFATQFSDKKADYVVTVETKGIPLAVMTADALNLPLVVARRESKVSEGSTVSINYISGSTDRIQKMSMSKRAIKPGSRAIVIDDFMKGGGTARGIVDILTEFDIEVVGIGVLISTKKPQKKLVEEYISLIYIEEVDFENKIIQVYPNNNL